MPTTKPRVLVGIALVASVGIGLCGCSTGQGATALTRAVGRSVTPSPSSHPRHLASSAPSRQPRTEPEQLDAVVQRYYAAFNTLHRTMDANSIGALFTASCPCQAQVAAIRRAANRGEHYIDRASVNVLRPSVIDHHHGFVLVNLDTGPGGLVARDGSRVTSAKPQHGIQRVFRLERTNGGWLISQIEAG